MRKLIISVLLVFVTSALPLKAQTIPEQARHEADSLKKVIADKKHKIDSLDLELKKFPDIKKQVESLENDYNKKSDTVRQLMGEFEKWRKTSDSLVSVFNKLGPEYDAQMARNIELEAHNQAVAPLVKRQLSQMANDIDQSWLVKTYAETEVTKLLEEMELYEVFKDADRGVGNAYVKLKTFSENVVLYRQGLEAVNSPYEAQKVADLVQPMGVLAKRETHQGRKQEAERVYGQLKDYKNTMRYFQEDIIPEVDKILNKIKKNKKEAWKQVKDYLETGDGGLIRQYLTKIPWIGKQYNLYIKQLESDPFGKNDARQTIMSIKP